MGPKKGVGTRGGAKGTPKQQKTAPEVNIGDFVSAGDSKDNKPKPKSSQRNSSKQEVSKDGVPEGTAGLPKRPTARALIGGASWTGKLPMSILSEHCQKQRWEKPEYKMTKTPDGFLSSVILKKTNPKTQETTSLPPMRLPPSHKHLAVHQTAMEARHFAAAYVLFRVCNMQNLHMMLPPTYRSLWKEDFTQLKDGDIKEGNAWMYEADPFLAMQERNNAAVELARARAERGNENMKGRESHVQLGLAPSGNNTKGSRQWQQAPKIDMGHKVRQSIEDLVRHNAIWNPYSAQMTNAERRNIINEFSGLGFRRSHVEEAVSECKDREEALEWLLIHVPEDDLPAWSLPEGYAAGICLASGDLAKESKIKRLATAGYSTELCAEILDNNDGDELLTAEYLQNRLVHVDNLCHGESATLNKWSWEEEHITLEAIFGLRYKRLSSSTCQITSAEQKLPSFVTFLFQKPSTMAYPEIPPILSISAKDIPAYIRLSAIRQAVQHAIENLLGEPMIFSLVDWLETNLPLILDEPGKLRNISVEPNHPVRDMISSQTSLKPIRNYAKNMDVTPGNPQSLSIRNKCEAKQSDPALQKMLHARKLLPAWPMQDTIIQVIGSHQVTIISGETGSGKSTQCVQFILDDMIRRDLGSAANIVCTQPRRISAFSLADRVSDERCSAVGDEVGYVVRGDSKFNSGITKITFMTTGVLLRRIQTGDGNVHSSLADISHVVMDEVHERNLDTDFLLALLKDVLKKRKDLKVVLMSATLDAEIFTRYFGGDDQVGRVDIPGRTFPVEDLYIDDVVCRTSFNPDFSSSILDEPFCSNDEPTDRPISKRVQKCSMDINYELIASTVRYIDSQLKGQAGGVLIFLPGTMEIDRCLAALKDIPHIYSLPLHASLLPAEQRRVFQPPPQNKRKVIAATNVAETSITIEDIVAVIDTGRVKETRYDPRDNIVRLEEVWASQAACRQRRGRAGRVRSGTCYKLYTEKTESSMSPRPEPEIRRVPLEQLCLSVKAMKGIQDVGGFLANTLTPPDNVAVEGALDLLHRIGALDNQRLTALGRYLSIIPTDLRCAKLMVYGAIFGCVEACLTIAAILTVKSPFISPRDKRDEAKVVRTAFSSGDGDLVVDLTAYRKWSEIVKSQGYWKSKTWCNANFLAPQTLRDISSNRSQLLTSLKEVGILPLDYGDHENGSQTRWNQHSGNMNLIRALVAGAFNPQIAAISFPDKKFAASMSGTVELDPEARTIKYFNQENSRVFVHPSSIVFDAQNFSGSATYVSYFTKMATSKVFIRDLTPFNAYGLLLFCGPITLDTLGRGVLVDGRLPLRGWARIGVLVSRLRMMLDRVLAKKIDNPALDVGEDKVIDIVRRLVMLNGQDQ